MKTIKEIDKQIQELKEERRKLQGKEDEKFLEEARKNIGRCFLVNDRIYVKVIDVPKKEYTLTHVEFNQYQYPAIYINDSDRKDVEPFYYDTLFSGAWGVGIEHLNTYKEISKEEFDSEFDRKMKEFTDYVKGF